MIKQNEVFKYQSLFLNKEIISPIEKSLSNQIYRVISFFSPTQFLVLIKSTYIQQIYLYTIGTSSKKLLLTVPIHKKIISASLSINEDKLFVVFRSSQNCLSKKPFYTVQCIIPNCNISYPVSIPIFHLIPKVECLDSNSKFIISVNNDQFEIYDIFCNEKEFQIHLDRKSKNGIFWWNLKNKNQLEYVKIDSKKEKIKFISSQKTFHLPILTNPLPSNFLYLNGDTNYCQDIILYQSKDTFGFLLPYSQVEIKLKYESKIENPNYLSNFTFYKNDLFMFLTPHQNIMFSLIDSLSQPRSLFEIELDKNNDEQYLMITSLNSLNCIHSQTGTQFSISFDYKSLILSDYRLFIPFFHYSIKDSEEKTFEFNFKNKSIRICHQSAFLSYLTNEILETFWNGTVFQEYFLCIFLRDIFQYLPQKQKDFFILHSTTFCPSNYFKAELKKFTKYQINENESAQQIEIQEQIQNKQNHINSWGILKLEDSNTFHEHFNIFSNTNEEVDYYYSTSIYEILIDLILSFSVEKMLADNLHFSSLIQITSLLSSVTDLSLDVVSNLYKKNSRDDSFLKQTKEVVLDSLSKSSSEFWEANQILQSSFSVPNFDSDLHFGTKILTGKEARVSWWKIHLNTQIKKKTEQIYGNSIFDAIAEATDDAKEEVQRSIISFYRPYFSDNAS